MQESEASLLVPNQVGSATLPVPKTIAMAGPAAGFCWEEFFVGQLRKRHTRAVYRGAVERD
jgi:hypothetical protein